MGLWDVLNRAKIAELTGSIKIDWNSSDARLIKWVKSEILPAQVLEFSTGYLLLEDGSIVGAKIGAGSRADLEQSLNTLMQMCYGIGCGILPSTTLTLSASEVSSRDRVGKLSDFDMMGRLRAIEAEAKEMQIRLTLQCLPSGDSVASRKRRRARSASPLAGAGQRRSAAKNHSIFLSLGASRIAGLNRVP